MAHFFRYVSLRILFCFSAIVLGLWCCFCGVDSLGLPFSCCVIAIGIWCFFHLPEQQICGLSSREQRRLKPIERFNMKNETRRTVIQATTAILFLATCFYSYLSARSASDSISTAQNAIRSQAEVSRETTRSNANSVRALRLYELRLEALRRYRSSTPKGNALSLKCLEAKADVDRILVKTSKLRPADS